MASVTTHTCDACKESIGSSYADLYCLEIQAGAFGDKFARELCKSCANRVKKDIG